MLAQRVGLLVRPALPLALFILSATFAWPALGQESLGVRGSIGRRIDFGARMPILVTQPVAGASTRDVFGTPQVTLDRTSTAVKNRVGVGPTVQVYLNNRLAISADLLYRRTGYGLKTDIEIADPDDDDVDETQYETHFERTRVDYYDLYILSRLYVKSQEQRGPWFYFLAGPTFRRAANVETWRSYYKDYQFTTTTTTKATVANRTVTGATAGFGLQFEDDFGVKFMPEFRYTRWMKDVFGTQPANSAKNQFEIVIGITW